MTSWAVPGGMNTEEFGQWWSRLTTIDKFVMVMALGQPFLRDAIAARNEVGRTERARAFFADPKNMELIIALSQGAGRQVLDSPRATPEQREFFAWYDGEIRRRIISGESYRNLEEGSFWRFLATDVAASVPYFFIAPLNIGGKMLGKAAVAAVRMAWGAGVGATKAVSRPFGQALGRLVMRESEALVDQHTSKMIEVLENWKPWFQEALGPRFPQWWEEQMRTIAGFRREWADRYTGRMAAQQIADGKAAEWLTGLWRQGYTQKQFWLASTLRGMRFSIWQEWQKVQIGIQNTISDLRVQRAALKDPEAIARMDAVIQQEVNNLYRKAEATIKAIRNLSPHDAARRWGVTISAEDAKRVLALNDLMTKKANELLPPGAKGWVPFYSPAFPLTAAKQRLLSLPRGFNPSEIEREFAMYLSGVPENPERAIRAWHQRIMLPTLLAEEAPRAERLQQWITQVAGQVEEAARGKIAAALANITAEPITRGLLGKIGEAIATPVKHLLLIGRLPAWVSTNILGNVSFYATDLIEQWARGRYVDPMKFITSIRVPMHVLGPMSEEVSFGGIGLVRRLYSANSLFEGWFRSAVWKREVAKEMQEFVARGIPIDQTIMDEISRRGWKRANEVFFDYADRFVTGTIVGDLSYFLQFRVENLKFWVYHLTSKPWLLPTLVRLAEERPELEAPVGAIMKFVGEHLGIDTRKIDIMAKMPVNDVLQMILGDEPKWIKERKARLSVELSAVMSKYRDNPQGLQAYMEAHPDLAAYQRYVEMRLGARLLMAAYRGIRPGAVVEGVMEDLGVPISFLATDRAKRPLVPHIPLARDALVVFGRKFGIKDLEKLLVVPEDAAIKREVQRLLVEESLTTGKPVRDTSKMSDDEYAALWSRATNNIIERRFLDRTADLLAPLGAGSFGLRYQQDLYDRLSEIPGFNEMVTQGRFIPRPADIHTFVQRYGLDEPTSIYLARRKYTRQIEARPRGERAIRSAAFDNLPDEIKNLLQVAPPTDRGILQRIDRAMTLYESMLPGPEKRAWLKSDDPQARLLRAYLETQYSDQEMRIVDAVSGMTTRQKMEWYRTARVKAPEDARMFAELFPSLTEQFRAVDLGTPPGEPRAAPGVGTQLAGVPAPAVPLVSPRQASPAQLPPGVPPLPPELDPAVPLRTQGKNWTLSAAGRQYIRSKEGRRLTAYRDPGGVWTIGWGHTGLGVATPVADARRRGFTDEQIEQQGLVRITAEQADRLFDQDAKVHETAVQKALGTFPVSQQQFDALVSFSYNAGPTRMRRVVELMKAGKTDEATAYMASITRDARGNELPGLVTRRAEEIAQLTGVPSTGPAAAAAKRPPAEPTGQQQLQRRGAGAVDYGLIPVEAREAYRIILTDGAVVYKGNIGQALYEYIRFVNPQLDPRVARRIQQAIMTAYEDPADTSRTGWHSFDPLWIAGIVAARSGFNPSYAVGGRFGLGGLTSVDAPLFTVDELLDPAKNIRALIDRFKKLQLELGTKAAIEALGLDFPTTYNLSSRVLGLRPVWYPPLAERGQIRKPIERPDTPPERSFATFYSQLLIAGGDREDPEFLTRRRKEWAELAAKAPAEVLEMLKVVNPDLFFHVMTARNNAATWWRGRVAIEVRRPDMPEGYLEWKGRILGANSLDSALALYRAGTPEQRAWFRRANGDMDRFFQDRIGGIVRDYSKTTFTDAQDPTYLDARAKLARALASGDAQLIRATAREIRSIYKDDVPGFLRMLKQDDPDMFQALGPYMEARPYGPDEQYRVLQLKVAIDDLLKKAARGDTEARQQAAAILRDPANADALGLAQTHEVAWYARVQRELAGEPAIGHYIRPDDTLPFERWRNDLEEAARRKDAETLRAVWGAAPESFRKEYAAFHTAKYVNVEAVLNGATPAEWVAYQQKRLYAPYLDFLRANDAYGAWSAEKLALIEKEDPGALAYIMSDPDALASISQAYQQRLASLYIGVLRQFDYNPNMLMAVPDDGTRYLLTLLDPGAKDAFARFRISVTPREIGRVRSVEEVWGPGAIIEPVFEEGRFAGRYKITRPRRSDIPGQDGTPETFLLTMSEIVAQRNALMGLPEVNPQVVMMKRQMEWSGAFVNALQVAYRGYEIAQQGGGFLEQLPAYFGAAQQLAAAGIIGGPVGAFLAGPWGLLAGGVLGILGSILGRARQRRQQEEARRREEREIAIREAEAIRARLQQMDQAQLLDVEARTGAIRAFVERPTAITRQALLTAMGIPRPTW